MARAWMVTALLAGCTVGVDDPFDGGQFGEEVGAECVEVDRVPLGLEEISQLGVSGADVLAMAEGTHTSTMAWSFDGSQTGVTVEVTYDAGAIAFVDYEIEDSGPDGGMEPALSMSCPDTLEVGVELSVTTDDGQLAESWSAPLIAQTTGSASARFELDEGLTGTFDAWDHVDADNDYDELSADLLVRFDDQGSWGTVSGQGEGSDGDPDNPNSVVWAENFDLGSWAPPGAEQ